MTRLSALIALGLVLAIPVGAQELFVHAEAASNSPRGVPRLRFALMDGDGVTAWSTKLFYSFSDTIMAAGNFHGDFADGPAGGGIYLKYRFLTLDSPHRHFRMAAFAEADLATRDTGLAAWVMGVRRGAGAGLIGTYLVNRTAVSGTGGVYRAVAADGHDGLDETIAPFSLSLGHLVLPRRYRTYSETNLNLYLELPGVWTPQGTRLEIAPAVQLIFNSSTKLDLSVRRVLADSIPGSAPTWIAQVALEHYFF